jgi:hypothetical protein
MQIRYSLSGFVWLALMTSCSSLPTVKHDAFQFPKESAFIGDVKRPYKVLGLVRAKAEYQTLDENHEETQLCKNYYNKAVGALVKTAKEKGGDAVIDVKSVVFLEDGRREEYTTPECSDDGLEGQALTQGIAVKWIKLSKPSPGSDKTFRN